MSKLATRAELDKLGVTLGLGPSELAFLEAVPAEQLRALRIAIYERLFGEERALLRRLGRIASALPPPLAAWLAQRLIGPFLTARVAAEVPSRRLLELTARLPAAFFADVCVDLDPRRSHDVLRRVPPGVVVSVAQVLAARGDFMTMSRFAEFFDDAAIQAVLGAIEDEGFILRVAFYIGSKNRLDHLFRLLPAERTARLIDQVRTRDELIVPFLSLLVHVSYARKRELGDLAAQQDEAAVTRYVRAVHEHDLWPDMLPVLAAMSESSRRRVVNLPILREPLVQESVIRAADERNLWGVVLPLVAIMDDANREAVAEIVAARAPQTLQNAADAALMVEQWATLVDLIRRMPSRSRQQFASIMKEFGAVDPDLLRRVAREAEAAGLAELVADPLSA